MKSSYLLAIATLYAILSACNPAPVPEAEDKSPLPTQPLTEAVYRFPLPADPPTLDPMHITDTVSDTVVRRIFNGLVRFSPDLQIVPDLAENWIISDNGLKYKFFIREGVRFHNGREVTAEDVLYSFTRLVDSAAARDAGDMPSERAQMLFPVKGARAFFEGNSESFTGFEAPDENTFVIHLEQQYAPFLAVLCMSNFAIVPREVVEEDWKGFAQKPFLANQRLRLVSGCLALVVDSISSLPSSYLVGTNELGSQCHRDTPWTRDRKCPNLQQSPWSSCMSEDPTLPVGMHSARRIGSRKSVPAQAKPLFSGEICPLYPTG